MAPNIDQTTIIWKKKYLPHFNEVKETLKKLSLNQQDDINSKNNNET